MAERRGWVARRPCPDDARATLAELSDDGLRQVVATAPGHAEAVRALVFDGLTGDDVEQLDRLCEAILEQVDAR